MNRRRPWLAAACALAVTPLVACRRGDPPSYDGGPGTSLSVAPLPAAYGGPAASAPPAVGGATPLPRGTAPSAASSSPTPTPSVDPPIVLPEGDPGHLPQTQDRPGASPLLDARARTLFRAIVEDRPEVAMPFFFPVTAYAQVKDIPNADADWKRRLVAAYTRDIHDLHIKFAKASVGATYGSLEIPEARGRWVEPGEEYNKLGYYRVFGSKLRFTDGAGRPHTVDLKSLISWRGEWFVVHLSGMK